jgi:uncharacterized membrane protein YgaE (UPF0421/DUF939 family)
VQQSFVSVVQQSLTSAGPVTDVVVGLVTAVAVVTVLRRNIRPAVARAYRTVTGAVRPYTPLWIRRYGRWTIDRVDAEAVRSVAVTGAAAGLAWAAATVLGWTGPVTAAISAVLSVQLSSHASLKEGGQRLVATLAGIGAALVVWRLYGVTPLSVALIAAAGLAAGKLLRLGDAAVAVPATSLGVMVVGSTVTDTIVMHRVGATALGIIIGVILSPLVGGISPRERARLKLADLSSQIARLLGEIGAGAGDGYTREQATVWLSTSRKLDEDLAEARTAVDDVVGQARWSLTTPVAQAAALQETLRILEHGVGQVNSVARTMFDAAAVASAPDVPEQLGDVLAAAADAFAAHAELVADPDTDPAGTPEELAEPLDELREARERTIRSLRDQVDDTGVLLLTGSILTDVDRMTESLDRTAPALTVDQDTPEPVIPAVSEVLPAVKDVLPTMRKALRGRTRP